MSFRSVESFWLPHRNSLLWGVLLLTFALCALWETFQPRRALAASTGRRWANHAVIWLLGDVAVVWIFRVGAVVAASAASAGHYGLLTRVALPSGVRCAIGILLLDLLRYGQHYLNHAVPVLWRIHRVHHSDRDYDWSTGLRFHPLEVLLTQGIYLGAIVAIAPPALAVLSLELADAAVNFFVHANVALPRWIETRLRRVVITPDMHRIHHSEEIAEQNSNFGIVFPWWDRMFGTYLREPAAGQDGMAIGLDAYSHQHIGLTGMLIQPFHQ